MIHILIIDDHAIVRKGLVEIVADLPDIQVTGEAADGAEGLDMIARADYDVVLLDISMPGQGGLAVLEQIKQQKPRLPVLILSMFPEEQYAVRALKLGAAGYLTKESAPASLITAIRKIAGGGKYVNPSLAEKLADYIEVASSKARHETLSNREFQVMLLIAAGHSVKDIAEDLALSPKTISTHRTRILNKMKFANNAEIIRYAITHQLTN